MNFGSDRWSLRLILTSPASGGLSSTGRGRDRIYENPTVGFSSCDY